MPKVSRRSARSGRHGSSAAEPAERREIPVCAAALRFGIAALAAALVTAPSVAAPDRPACTTPVVTTPSGRFCGLAVKVGDAGGTAEVDAYQGIRYGTAQRWHAPVAVAPSTGLFAATRFGPICPQVREDGLAQSEDCLWLNLWTPTRSSVKRLPVMVFIHGGAFVTGAGSLPVYDAARLAARGDVVVVTLNYRLGALGFLAGGNGAGRLAGNFGFRDQQLALGWVAKNIRSFGGDPAKVTIFGESAGAISVGVHLVAPASRSLFRNALMESDPYGIPLKNPAQADNIRQQFDQTPPAQACGGRLSCLDRLPAATIVKAQGQVLPLVPVLAGRLGEILAWAPFVDRQLIAEQPNQAAITRPLIAGTNRDEGTLFVDEALPASGLSDFEYGALVTALFKLDAPAILLAPRYQPDGRTNLVPLANIVGDYFFSCATRHVLGRAKGAAFGYAFDHPPSYAVWPGAPTACQPGPGPNRGRVCHTLELPFVFRNPITVTLPPGQQHFTPAEARLVDRISAYWTGLAGDGDPNSRTPTPPAWPRYRAAGIRQVLNLRISQTDDAALSCPLWDKIGYGPGAISLY
jgi:carboxylesterase type B